MKKVFSLLLALSMLITGSFGVMAQAQTIEPTNFDEINFQITSKENPDAYIESRFVPGNSAYARSSEEDGKTLVGYVDATVYVEETYTKAITKTNNLSAEVKAAYITSNNAYVGVIPLPSKSRENPSSAPEWILPAVPQAGKGAL